MQLEADVSEVPLERQMAGGQQHCAPPCLADGRRRGQLASDHHAHDRLAREGRGSPAADVAAVAQHGQLVGDREQLLQPMGDVEDAFALGLELANDREQVFRVPLAERRGGLVHDEQLRLIGERSRDLDHLAGGYRECAHLGLGIDVDPQPLEQGAGPALQLAMADESQSVDGLAPDPDVLRDAHARHQVQLLMDHGDAKVKRIARRAEAQIAAVEEQLAGIRSVDTCDDLHERRLAGAVLAAQSVHRAAPESHRHIVQGHDSGKRLADIPDFEEPAVSRAVAHRSVAPEIARQIARRHQLEGYPDEAWDALAPGELQRRIDGPSALGGGVLEYRRLELSRLHRG